MSKVFKRPIDTYQRLPDPVNCYIKDAAIALSKRNKKSIEENVVIVKKLLSTSDIKNPEVKFRETLPNGDRIISSDKLSNYINHIRTDTIVTAPSFTSYVHPDITRSLQAGFLDKNIALRKSDKANAFLNRQKGDTDKYIYYNTLQKTRKIFNNSLSGAYASKSTILYTPTAHYTLTSTTRQVASIGNAISESIIAGNRLYKDPESVINHILTLCRFTTPDIKETVDAYHLHIPTTDEVIDVLKMSSDSYFIDDTAYATIRTLVDNCSSYEKCNIVYNNDLWHLKEFNQSLIKDFITKVINNVIIPISELGDIDNILKTADEGILNLLYHLNTEILRGKDRQEWTIEIKQVIASGVIHIEKCLLEYETLISTFLITDVLPPNIAYIKDMFRDCIVLSDTDSTVGSYDQWSKWYFGKPTFGPKATQVTAFIMTINTQVIDHYIKMFASNMNVAKKDMNTLVMKNEYYWSSFSAANVSKHYYAQVIIQEGNVLPKPALELKGVHLIASKSSVSIRTFGLELINSIQDAVNTGTKISLTSYITKVAGVEREIIKSIKNGNIDIFSMEKIKEEVAYKNEASMSPFLHHLLWKEVFSPKYGPSDEPQYMVLKIPTKNMSKRKMNDYLETIEDIELRDRLIAFIKKHRKEQITTFKVPLTIAAESGVPEEMLLNLDIERLVSTSCNMLYVILETIGFHRKKELLISQMGY